jgi:hypothetical protein
MEILTRSQMSIERTPGSAAMERVLRETGARPNSADRGPSTVGVPAAEGVASTDSTAAHPTAAKGRVTTTAEPAGMSTTARVASALRH